jgi:hypothetical protein
MKPLFRTVLVASTLAVTALAQDASTALVQDDAQMKKLMVELQQLASAKAKAGALAPMAGIMTVVKNAPYSADQVTENTQVLGDGTRIHTESKVAVARDSQGRVRQETPDRITIWDPVENVTYVLNPKTKSITLSRVVQRSADGNADITKRFSFPPGEAGAGNVAFDVSPDGGPAQTVVINGFGVTSAGAADLKLTERERKLAQAADQAKMALANGNREALGIQRMEGIGAEGTRETHTIEAGAIGNDRPISVISERWYSSELQTEMMTRHSDPRTGEQVTRLTNVRLGEPDSTLFQVPAGYQKPGDLPPMMNLRK